MAKARKLASGNWSCQVMSRGVRRSFTAPTKKSAELAALSWVNSRTPDPAFRTVGECVEDYIESKKNVLSPTTIDSYRRRMENDLGALLAVPVADLSQLIVQKAFNELALTKSPKTVRVAHGLLVSVLNVYAPEIRLRTSLPPLKKKLRVWPSVEQVLAAVVGSPVELPCLLALWEGLRMSEIRGARVSDISPDGVLMLQKTIVTVAGEHIEKDSMKTYESARLVHLSPYLLDLVRKLPEGQEHLTELSGNAIYKRFSRLLEAAGVPHIRFHDLRHLNASTMVALNVPDVYAMERGGWSSPSIMKSVYQHTLTDERRSVDEKIDGYFENILEKIKG